MNLANRLQQMQLDMAGRLQNVSDQLGDLNALLGSGGGSGGGGGIESGAQFPVSPAAGDLFFRTDLLLLCVRYNQKWVTVNEYSTSRNNDTLWNTGTSPLAAPVGEEFLLSRVSIVFFVAAPNNATNFWAFEVSFTPDSSSYNYDPPANNLLETTNYPANVRSGGIINYNQFARGLTINVQHTKNGSPGYSEWQGLAYYRRVISI